ncbi:MAG: high frequency lysogenization protein HflD [Gammaproteobacteria bacterium]
MTIKTPDNRALAFAGMLQALQLVQQVAHGKPRDLDSVQASLRSILALDADTVDAVYGGIEGVRAGLRLLKPQLLGGARRPDQELNRYLVVLLHLERKLSKRADLLERLRTGIDHTRRQLEHFDITHASVVAGLADTYSDTVSTLNPRIMINGDPERLRDSNVANQIRALLLAAMRSAVLWRQCGGTRLGLLFGRRRLVKVADNLLRG